MIRTKKKEPNINGGESPSGDNTPGMAWPWHVCVPIAKRGITHEKRGKLKNTFTTGGRG